MLLASSEVEAQMQKLPASPHKACHLCSEFFSQKTKQSTKLRQIVSRDMCSSMTKLPAKKLKCC